MNIQEFFELSAGKWFAHRTIQDLASNQSKEAKSEILIEKLPTTHPDVVNLCQVFQVNNPSLIAAKINWNDTTKLNQKNVGSTVLVLVPDQNAEAGQLLRQVSNEDKPSLGYYKLSSDESLLLSVESGKVSFEERLWFASNNLRMRVNVMKHAGGISTTSFTSEIRMGVSSAQPTSTASSASS
ncbi:MAG: phycobiliprotein lyase [Calothrix sp. C42_A2020_038]|nr:phycobiliprotein lyase [Calothrix sp. C42_A2020_038]